MCFYVFIFMNKFLEIVFSIDLRIIVVNWNTLEKKFILTPLKNI